MIAIDVDIARNRLVLTLKGRPSNAQFEQARAQVTQAITRLKPPFDLLSDVSELESLEQIESPQLSAVVALVLSGGVRRTVRVVGKSARGALQMERIARSLNHHAYLAFSLDEAEQVFAQR